jgi:hypothetical protein
MRKGYIRLEILYMLCLHWGGEGAVVGRIDSGSMNGEGCDRGGLGW